jgi:hypothetical protein
MVDLTNNTPSRTLLLDLKRFDFRNANSGVFLDILHGYGNECWR